MIHQKGAFKSRHSLGKNTASESKHTTKSTSSSFKLPTKAHILSQNRGQSRGTTNSSILAIDESADAASL